MRIGGVIVALVAIAGCDAAPEQDEREASVPAYETAQPSPVPTDPPIAKNPYRGEAGMDDFTWFRRSSKNEAGRPVLILMYGAPGGSEIAINLQCSRRGAITIVRGADSYASAQAEIVLRSDRTVASLSLQGADPPNGQSEFFGRAELPADAPVLKAFAETGLLTVAGQGAATQVDAIDEREKHTVRTFFRNCSKL